MLTSRDLLAGILLPAALSAAIVWVAWWATRRTLGRRHGRLWAEPLAIGLGFSGAWLALFGPEEIPPADATGWLLLASVPLAIVGTVEAWCHFPLQMRLVSAVVGVVVVFWLLARPLLVPGNPAPGATIVLLSIAVPLAVGWIAAMDQLGGRVSSVRLSAILLIAALPAAWALGHSGSQRLAQIAAALAATQLGIVALACWLRLSVSGRGAAMVYGVLYVGLLLCGQLYADLSALASFVLLVAPCLAWLVEPWSRQLGRRKTALVQLALVAATAVASSFLPG